MYQNILILTISALKQLITRLIKINLITYLLKLINSNKINKKDLKFLYSNEMQNEIPIRQHSGPGWVPCKSFEGRWDHWRGTRQILPLASTPSARHVWWPCSSVDPRGSVLLFVVSVVGVEPVSAWSAAAVRS